MPDSSGFAIRKMSRTDLDLALDWAAAEGWNPGRHDAGCFYDTDPDGYFMAFQGDKPIGSVSAVAYDENFGFIGLFIVRRQYRGGCVGIQLGRHAMNYLGARLIGIDGVEKKEKNYAHYGFKLAFHTMRYEGRGIAGRIAADLCPIAAVPFDLLAAYDRLHFPAPRPQFLSRWIKQPESAGFAIRHGAALAGYGMIRACRTGYKIGPLFADDPADAQALLLGLATVAAPNDPVCLDVPESNSAGVELALAVRMKPVFRTARMYNRAEVKLPLPSIFGITSFELG